VVGEAFELKPVVATYNTGMLGADPVDQFLYTLRIR
jgi:hypothetical protein